MGLACREACGMLSIWGGTYGGTIPGIPNGFGLAVSSTRGQKNKTTVSRGRSPKTPRWQHGPRLSRPSRGRGTLGSPLRNLQKLTFNTSYD